MDLQTIRTEMQLNPQLFEAYVYELFPNGIDFCNPDFINIDEESARAGKVFVGSAAFPTDQEKIDAYVPATKGVARMEIRTKYATLMQQIAKPYSPEERETWFKQQKAYEVYQADGTILPYIQTMADSRGIAVTDLLAKIGENIDLYDQAIFDLLGKQQKELDALK